MHRSLSLLVLLALVIALPAALARSPAATAQAQPPATCGLASPAFCDTFDAPVGGGERSGDLDATVWGVARASSSDNIGQGISDSWSPASLDLCGTPTTTHAGTDVRICDGQLREAVDDGGNQTVLAMYPRQPFDIAGRTGVVAFDVGDDTGGGHTAWPAVVYSDQPVPAPYGNAPAIQDRPRDSIGVSFAGLCGAGSPCRSVPAGADGANCWTVDQLWETANYAYRSIAFVADSCAVRSTGADGGLNTVHIALSSSGVWVYASDPGSPASLRLIAHADAATDPDFSMPLTRGLVWLEDAHYNAAKYCVGDPEVPPCERDHTFAWDNFGFDGPVLPRDLGVELPDNTQPIGADSANLGWTIPQAGSVLAQTFSGVSNVAGAQAALLEFTCYPTTYPQSADSFAYAINGHAAQTATPTMGDFGQQTVALPVPLADLRDGDNVLTISDATERIDAANFDLILVGAGQQPPTPTPAPTTTTTTSATSSQTATATASTWTLICSEMTGDPRTVACRGVAP